MGWHYSVHINIVSKHLGLQPAGEGWQCLMGRDFGFMDDLDIFPKVAVQFVVDSASKLQQGRASKARFLLHQATKHNVQKTSNWCYGCLACRICILCTLLNFTEHHRRLTIK